MKIATYVNNNSSVWPSIRALISSSKHSAKLASLPYSMSKPRHKCQKKYNFQAVRDCQDFDSITYSNTSRGTKTKKKSNALMIRRFIMLSRRQFLESHRDERVRRESTMGDVKEVKTTFSSQRER